MFYSLMPSLRYNRNIGNIDGVFRAFFFTASGIKYYSRNNFKTSVKTNYKFWSGQIYHHPRRHRYKSAQQYLWHFGSYYIERSYLIFYTLLSGYFSNTLSIKIYTLYIMQVISETFIFNYSEQCALYVELLSLLVKILRFGIHLISTHCLLKHLNCPSTKTITYRILKSTTTPTLFIGISLLYWNQRVL